MLKTIKRRLPSKTETILLFLGCVFIIHIWSILMFLRKIPAYVGRMDLGTMISVFAYSQTYALIESILALGVLVAVGIVLPKRYFRENFLPLGLMFFLVTYIWMMPLHFSIRTRFTNLLPLSSDIQIGMALIWVVLYFLFICAVPHLFRRNKGLGQGIKSFIARISVLSVIYILVDFTSLFLVTYRNLR